MTDLETVIAAHKKQDRIAVVAAVIIVAIIAGIAFRGAT